MTPTRSMVTLIVLGLLAGLSTAPVYADDARELFKQGQSLFKQGQLNEAIEAFTGARRAGLDHPALYYNLGVAYYRSNRYQMAYDSFRMAASNPKFSQLIHYNLGLSAQKLGQSQLASAWFEKAARGEKAKIRALALYQLDQQALRVDEDLAIISLGLGHDDNVLDPNTLTGDSESDQYLEFYLSGRQQIAPNWQLNASIFLQDYLDTNTYDLMALKLGTDHVSQNRNWKTTTGVSIEHSTLDGSPYLNTFTLGYKNQQLVQNKDRWRWRLRASQISAADNLYDPQSGMQVRADLRWQSPQRDWTASYGFEWNDRDDLQDATTFTSYSPTRHSLKLDWHQNLGHDWQTLAGVTFKTSSYADPNRLSDGTRIDREDTLVEYELGVEKNLDDQLVFSINLLASDNESNIDDYDYTRNQVLIGINYLFD